jgi:hypothetical protein
MSCPPHSICHALSRACRRIDWQPQELLVNLPEYERFLKDVDRAPVLNLSLGGAASIGIKDAAAQGVEPSTKKP